MKCQELIDLLQSHGFLYVDHPFKDDTYHASPSYGVYPALYVMSGGDSPYCAAWITLETCEDYQEFIKDIHQPHPAKYTFTGNDGERYTCRLVENIAATNTHFDAVMYNDDGYLVQDVYTGSIITAMLFKDVKRLANNINNHRPFVKVRSKDYHGDSSKSGPLYLMYREFQGVDGKQLTPCCVACYSDYIAHRRAADYAAFYPPLKYWTKEDESKYIVKSAPTDCEV